MLLSVDAKAAVRMLVYMHRAKLIQVLRSAVAPTQVMSAVTGRRRRFAEKTAGYRFSRSAQRYETIKISAHSPRCGECAGIGRYGLRGRQWTEKVPRVGAQVRMSEATKSVRVGCEPGVQHACHEIT